MADEVWRDIKGYEGLCQVSNVGKVRSFARRGSWKTRILKLQQSVKRGNYFYVRLYKNNKELSYFVHRLVAKAFIPNLENKPQINHKNGNRFDNTEANLEWVTCKENLRHADIILGKKSRGEDCSFAKLTKEQVQEIRDSNLSDKDNAVKFNVSRANITMIRLQYTWKGV